ncbi:hypothetical protein GGU45_001802 [Niabella hirudinis]
MVACGGYRDIEKSSSKSGRKGNKRQLLERVAVYYLVLATNQIIPGEAT